MVILWVRYHNIDIWELMDQGDVDKHGSELEAIGAYSLTQPLPTLPPVEEKATA